MAPRKKIPAEIVDFYTKQKNEIIWENIERQRKKNGWKKSELAKAVGVGSQDIRKYSLGKNMGPEIFARFCIALNVRPGLLLGTSDSLLVENKRLLKKIAKLQHDLRKLEKHYYSCHRENDRRKLKLKKIRKFPLKLIK